MIAVGSVTWRVGAQAASEKPSAAPAWPASAAAINREKSRRGVAYQRAKKKKIMHQHRGNAKNINMTAAGIENINENIK